MPLGDPQDRFFYPTLTLMIDSYIIISSHGTFCEQVAVWTVKIEFVKSLLNNDNICIYLCRIVSSDKSTIVAQATEQPIGVSPEPSKRMGRKKIQISRIADERNRQVRYSKKWLMNQRSVIKAIFVCLFVGFDFLHPINNFSVKQGRVFLGWTSTKLG